MQVGALSQPESASPSWYAVYSRARHEKRVKQFCDAEGVECFLPLYTAVHRWKDRRAVVTLPLFPGYLFVHIYSADRMHVLTAPGVVDLVGTHGRPTPVPDHEVDALRTCAAHHLSMEPHPFLRTGTRVLVRRGPFADLEGILLRNKGSFRVVLSVNLIARSVAVEVDAADVVPAPPTQFVA